MKLTVDPEFRDLIPPLSDAERASLEASIIASRGPRDPILVWRRRVNSAAIVVDGHNRYEICTRLHLPFRVEYLTGGMDRDAVKAWIFENQIARRNLSHDQIVMLAAMRGVASERGTALQRERAAALAAAGKGAPVLAGRLSLALAWGAYARAAGLIQPRTRPPRGPDAERRIPEGHELAGVSTLTGADGAVAGQWNKTRVAGADEAPHAVVPEGHQIERTATMLRGDGTAVVQWVSSSPEKIARERLFWEACKQHAQEYRGTALPVEAPASTDDDLIAVYPIGDPHIGMLAHALETGAHFDLKIAEAELVECFRLLVARTPPARHALVLQLGDFLHAQDNAQVTPGHGNKLDVDGRTFKVQATGHRILRSVADLVKQRHEQSTWVMLPGNHDPNMSFQLAAWLNAVYENDPRVTIDPSIAPYFYHRFGVNLIGACHGDGAKEKDLPLLMATDAPDDWGATSHRVMHAGHIHHTRIIEHAGCRTWYHNTLAGKDAWHNHKGYRAQQFLESITYHHAYGQECTATVGIQRVRDALAKVAA